MQQFHNYYGDFVQPTWGGATEVKPSLPQKYTQKLDPVTEHATLIVEFYHHN